MNCQVGSDGVKAMECEVLKHRETVKVTQHLAVAQVTCMRHLQTQVEHRPRACMCLLCAMGEHWGQSFIIFIYLFILIYIFY